MGYPEGLEVPPRGEYRLDIASKFDKIMELSEQHGIYQKICIDYIRYISARGERRKTFDPEDNAYSVSNGGPCRNMRDFFALPEARRLFKNRLRYLVARWGYSTHVLAWELLERDRLRRQGRGPPITRWWSIGIAKCAGI